MENTLISWTDIGLLFTSMILVLITVTATLINYLFFRSQTYPDVIIYATTDNDRPSVIILIIENIGKSMAKNISFSTDKPLPDKAFGFENAPQPNLMKNGPIITGIPALGPGAKRIITWGQYGGLQKGIGDDIINVKIFFKAKKLIFFGYKKILNTCPLDIKSFEGIDAHDTNWDKKTFEQLKNIAKILEKNK
jgi:hypothetical protein